MNKYTVALLTILLVGPGLAARSELLAQRKTNRSSQVSPGLPLDKQAEQVAQQYWKKRVIRCGESHYKWGRIAINGPIGLIEMKSISFQTSGAPPDPPRTRADILNERDRPSGLQWQGQSILNHEVYRYMSRDSRAWNPWSNGGREVIDLEKRNGRWNLPADMEPISCQAVNAFALKPGALPTAGNPPTVDENGTLRFPARYPRWFSIGTGPLTLTIKGNPYPQIQFARGPSIAIPTGPLRWSLPSKFHNRALAPNLELGTLIAKAGETAEAFMPFQQKWKYGSSETNTEYRFDTTEEIFVAINDFNYSDNLGAYQFEIADRGNISGARLVNTENCYREQCQTWHVTLVRSDDWFDTGITINANQKVKVFGGDEAFSIRVGGISDETIKMGGKSLAFASQDYVNRWRGQIGSNYYVADPDWSATLQIKINDSYPHNVLRDVRVMVGPTRGM
jgi:hypothetical protein